MAATEDVNMSRPPPRATMSRIRGLVSRTVEVTLRSMTDWSSARSVSTKAPPCPTPALRAATSTVSPVRAATRWSTPSGVLRSARTARTATPVFRSRWAACSSRSSSALTTRS
ncbi:hypothetical protein RKD42_007644 [Streptomyces ambofaciens]